MKLLSIIVPCYNSQEYMRHCIDSLLPGGEDVEIVIVNDGSSDDTADIAEGYGKKYPNVIKVIHQKNAGHGGAINTGLQISTGFFIKVVDSDDWVDTEAYSKVLDTLKQFPVENHPDVFFSNYVYEKEGKRRKTIVRYGSVLPKDRLFDWSDVRRFRKGQYLLMHSIIYRRGLLLKCNLRLPQHTFYVDNLYAFLPLQHVRTMYYLDVDFYRYYIGRADQSVQEQIMIKRIDQQLYVNCQMVSKLNFNAEMQPQKKAYLLHYIEIVTMVSSVLLLRAGTNEHLQKKKELWQFIKSADRQLYNKMRFGFLGQMMHIPGTVGRSISLSVYKASKKVVGFN